MDRARAWLGQGLFSTRARSRQGLGLGLGLRLGLGLYKGPNESMDIGLWAWQSAVLQGMHTSILVMGCC